MTTYKAIRGLTIQTVAGDPDPLTTGDIWYSSITKKIRGAKLAAGAWSSGVNVNSARANLEGADGSSIPAGLIFAGRTTGSAGGGETEEYNGTAWSEQSDLNVDRWRGGGSGTQTAAMSFAGSTAPTTHVKTAEQYDGSSWTEVADVSSNHVNTVGFGTTTATLCVAGNNGTANVVIVEEWNGASWTEIADINSAKMILNLTLILLLELLRLCQSISINNLIPNRVLFIGFGVVHGESCNKSYSICWTIARTEYEILFPALELPIGFV